MSKSGKTGKQWCTQHLVRCVQSSHVFVLFCHSRWSGDKDPVILPISFLPAEHSLPTMHRIVGNWYRWRLLWCPFTPQIKGHHPWSSHLSLLMIFYAKHFPEKMEHQPFLGSMSHWSQKPAGPVVGKGASLCRSFCSKWCSQTRGSPCLSATLPRYRRVPSLKGKTLTSLCTAWSRWCSLLQI